MEDEEYWRTTFPSAAFAREAREFGLRLLQALEEGGCKAASEILRSSRWRRNIDLAGVPHEALTEIDNGFSAAAGAISAQDAEAARDRIHEVIQFCSP
jgi:hypothetical protein